MTSDDPQIAHPSTLPQATALALTLEQIAEEHHLNPATWRQLVDQSQRRDCRVGEVLFDEGDLNPNLYLLVGGQVDLSMKVTGRGWVKILSLAAGDIIAWSAMLSEGRMTCRATCKTNCELIYWKREQLDSVCRDQPEFGHEWMRFIATALSQRLLATRLQLLDLFAIDGRSR